MRMLRAAHAWAGAALCLLIALLGLSGALLVFKDDYLRLRFPEARSAPVLSPSSIGALTEGLEKTFGPGQLRTLVLAGEDLGIHHLYLRDRREAYIAQNGEVLALWRRNERLESWLFDLHHRLLIGRVGTVITGIAGLALCLFALTGLVLWWPYRKRFGWRLWPKSFRRADIVAAHRNLGVLAALPVLVVALSGAAIVFASTSKAILQGALSAASSQPVETGVIAAPGAVDWTRALSEAARFFPSAAPRVLRWPDPERGVAGIRLKQTREWHPNGRTSVSIDPATNKAVAYFDAVNADPGARAYNALYPIHAAFIGGRLYDLVSLFTGLACCILGLLGAFSFLRWKTKTGNRGKQAKPAYGRAA